MRVAFVGSSATASDSDLIATVAIGSDSAAPPVPTVIFGNSSSDFGTYRSTESYLLYGESLYSYNYMAKNSA
jgi:hypothetical protein